jgi:hypothetical protein
MTAAGAPRAVVVVDAGGAVGWGHFVRSRALADELERFGCTVELLVNGEMPPFAADGAGVRTGLAHGSVTSELTAGADAVVLDLKTYSPATPDGLPATAFVAVLVDSETLPFTPGLTVDPNVAAARHRGAALAGAGAVVLRPEFDELGTRPRQPGTLLLSFGGTAREALADRVTQAVRRQPAFSEVRDVLPGSAPVTPAAMRDLLLGAEAGVVAAGTLMHEACAAGLPVAVVSLDEAQHREATALAHEGAVLYPGRADELADADLDAALERLADAKARAALSARARTVIDTRGRERVAAAIVEALEERRG